MGAVLGDEDSTSAGQGSPPTSVTGEDSSSSPEQSASNNESKDTFNAKDHTDWGTYYDPKNIFCGKYGVYFEPIARLSCEFYTPWTQSSSLIHRHFLLLIFVLGRLLQNSRI